jgi:hypothetical protein
MSTLFGNNISQTYQGLIKLADSTTGVTSTTQSFQDGLGNNIPIQVSNTTVNISGSFLVNGQPVSIETGSFATTGSNTFIGNQTITGSVNVTGTITANSASFNYLETVYETASIIYSSGSNQFGDASNDTQTLWGTVNIPSGSVNITGSLNVNGNTTISGSIIGGALNGGLIKIQTEANRNGAVQFNITSSLPVSSSNIVMGQIGPSSTQTGSVVISGSNNIIFNGYRPASAANYGYMTNQNIVSTIPTLNTGSLIRPGVSNNQLNGALIMNYITSSVGGGSINNNLIYGGVNINSQSGSLFYTNNYNNSNVTINQNTQNLTGSQSSISNNTFGGTIQFNAISSSINASSNITFGNNTIITSSFFNTGSNNSVGVSQNLIGGSNNHIQFGGNPATNTGKNYSQNILGGAGNVINLDATGSDAGMFNTIVFGSNLSVNPKEQIIGQAVFGKWNKTITGSTIFVVGNGTNGADRRNAIEVTTNNETILTGSVKISGSLNTTGKINDLKIHTGSANVNSIGIGNNTLQFQSSSSNLSNVAIGNGALSTNVTGSNIVAIGNSALGNSVSSFNLAVGAAALGANTTGESNIAIGQSAFQANTIGGKNTAIGWNSGVNNLTGSTNTIIGAQALSNNVNGSGNIAIGHYAGYYSTGSNGFYVGNDNYGGLNTEQNKSLMYGEFNNTTANQTLQINAKTTIKDNLVVTGSITVTGGITGSLDKTGLITTGSVGQTQQYTGSLRLSSGSLLLDDGTNSAKIADYYNRNVIFKSEDLGKILVGGNCNMDQIDTQFGVVSGSQNLFVFGGNTLNFRTGSNNTFFTSSPGLVSGSNNTFIGTSPQFSTGSGNFIIGGFNDTRFSGTSVNNVFSIGAGTNNSFLFKEGNNPLTTVGNATISGSLIVSGSNLLVNDISVGRGGGTSNTNTAIGNNALVNNTTGIYNTAVGNSSLGAVTTQTQNTAVGYGALGSNIAISNTAVGAFSMNANTTGRYNVSLGQAALDSNTTGEGNTSIGFQSLERNVSGNYNVAIGHYAGSRETGNNNLLIDVIDRGSQDAARSGSLIYGTFNSTVANQTLQINAATNIRNNLVVSGSLRVSGDVMFASGSNKTMGTVVLDGGNPGVATVSNSLVTSNSLIFLTKQTNTNSGNGTVSVTSKGSGTFSITSDHNGDTDVVAYQIINPA